MQKFKNVQHIIIDGGSKDDTLKIIKAKQIPNTILISEKDEGISDAFNKGLQNCTGDIVGFLNSDDCYYDSDCLSNIAHNYVDQETMLCGNIVYDIDDDNSKVIKSRPWKLKHGMYICHPTLYIPIELIRKINGFNKKYKIAMDYDFVLRIFSVSDKIKVIDKVLVRMAAGGASGNSIRAALEELKVKNENLGLRLSHYLYFNINFCIALMKKWFEK